MVNILPRLSRLRLLAFICLALSEAAQATSLLIRNVTPVDPVAGALPVQDLLLRDGKIAAMGSLENTDPSVPIVDGQGQFLIPGLWDMHVHLTYDPRLTAHMPSLFIRYGITSVRDTGGMLDQLLPIRDRFSSRDDAPSIYISGPLLDGKTLVYDGDSVPLIGVSNSTVEAATTQVQLLADAGVDFIKIYEMVGPEIFEALVDAAQKHNLPIAAHVPLSLLARDVAPHVDSLEHFRNLALDCADNADALLNERLLLLRDSTAPTGYAKRASIHAAQREALERESPTRCKSLIAALKNTIQVPTLRLTAMTQHPPFAAPDWEQALSELPIEVSTDWRRAPQFMDPETFKASGEWALKMLGRLYEAEVPIGAGTDTPIGWAIPGFSLHRELELFTLSGMRNIDALASATIVPASFFDLEDSLGRIAEGYAADLVLLNDNPLLDIRNTRHINAVIRGGIVVSATNAPANRQ